MRQPTWDRVYARRLARSHLLGPAPVLDVVRDTLGIHAQLATAAKLALSARSGDVRLDELLWERRQLVKGNTIRGTLHLNTPEDFALWKSAYEPRWRTEAWLRWHELSLRDAERLRESVLAVLDEPKTREEIGREVGGAFGRRIAEDSWGHLLSPANDSCCQGPPRGRNVTFVRADAWIAGFRRVDRLDALRRLVARYVETYGPVERRDLEHWLAQPLPGELEVPDPGAFPDEQPSGVRLLYHYDPYVIACHPRGHLIPEQRQRVFLRGAGPKPTLLVDGRVRGVWRREGRSIAVEPFVGLTDEQLAELDRERERVTSALSPARA